INMAHGELMAMGSYMTYVTSVVFQRYFPEFMGWYFIIGIGVAFVVTFAFGFLLERCFIRFMYNRPLDTLLATWGLSLVLQQLFRQVFGPKEVSVPTVQWLQGAWKVSEGLELPLNRIFIIGLTFVIAAAVFLFLYRSRWGLRIRAVTQNRAMAGAAGINTARVDSVTFALGCGLAGIAGSSFTMLASTGPVSGQQYLVDTFIVVVFGGVESMLGTFLSAFAIGQTQISLEYLTTGSMAKAITLLVVIVLLFLRPNGLFATKVRR
ncbi:urea ABC transporter permease subunit UrtB, partial [Pseudomonas syringae]